MDVNELIKKEGLRRGLSPRTIKTYQLCVYKFLEKLQKDIRKITKKDVKDFLDYKIEKGSPGNTINVYLNAINFFYTTCLNKKLVVSIRYSKTPKKLPVFLSKKEVRILISNISNPKHKLMIQLLYSSGMRVSELVSLKVKDLNFEKNYGWVRSGKGNKDRMFIIARSIVDRLSYFISSNKLKSNGYLFLGQNRNHYSTRSIQEILKEASKKAKLTKIVTPHMLRHSFATHLVENDYPITTVQLLLGHNSPRTTQVYVHMASPTLLRVESPLDRIQPLPL